MTTNLRLIASAAHAVEAHALIGHLAWTLRQLAQDGGFHTLSVEARHDLSSTAQAATRQLLRACAILSDMAEFTATVRPHTGSLCECGNPAEWEKSILIGNGPRPDKLHLCTKHLLESFDL